MARFGVARTTEHWEWEGLMVDLSLLARARVAADLTEAERAAIQSARRAASAGGALSATWLRPAASPSAAGAALTYRLSKEAELLLIGFEAEDPAQTQNRDAFRRNVAPLLADSVLAAFPNAATLPPHAVGALMLLVAEDPAIGASPHGRSLQDLVARKRLRDIPSHLRAQNQGVTQTADPAQSSQRKRRETAAVLMAAALAEGEEAMALQSADANTTDPALEREALAYEVAALMETSETGGADDDLVLENLHIGRNLRSVTDKGRAALDRFETQLKRKICNPARLAKLSDGAKEGAGAEAAGEAVDAAAQELAALDGTDPENEGLRAYLADTLAHIAIVLPRPLCRRIVDGMIDQVVWPTVGMKAANATAHLCACWGMPEGAAETETEKTSKETPEEKPVTTLSHDAPADPSQPPTIPDDVAALAKQLAKALLDNPGALDADTHDALRKAISGVGRSPERDPRPLIDALIPLASARPLDHQKIDMAVEELAHALTGWRTEIPRDAAMKCLKSLKNSKLFDALTKLADRFLSRDPVLIGAFGEIYAQGLIDSGRVRAGIEVLNRTRATLDRASADDAWRSATALLGRAHKQLYMNHIHTPQDAAAAPEVLTAPLAAAIDFYQTAHDGKNPADGHWPYVNHVALLHRARADHVSIGGDTTPEALARRLIEALTPAVQDTEHWDYVWRVASLAEAHLAIDAWELAARWFGVYGAHADAFALSSTIRQLEEVWRLSAAPSGAGAILTGLKAQLAAKENGVVTLSAIERRDLGQLEAGARPEFAEHFEKETVSGRRVEFRRLFDIVRHGAAVCAMQETVRDVESGREIGRTVGTGFLIDPSGLSPALSPDKSYVLTNAHVLWDGADPGQAQPRFQDAALEPSSARIMFESGDYDGAGRVYRCARVLWQSPAALCDAALIELDRRVEDARIEPLRLSEAQPP
ncbi:MAG: serine protease, partial [Rhodobacteraceae bacterium]|nr:serine protease [Paracoccaceae bacterium]